MNQAKHVSTEYFIGRNNENHGPYDLENLRQYYKEGQFLDTDLVWAEHLPNWIPLSDLPERHVSTLPISMLPPLSKPPNVQPQGGTRAFVDPDNKTQKTLSSRINDIRNLFHADGIAAIPKLVPLQVLSAYAVFFIASHMEFLSFTTPAMSLPSGSFSTMISTSGLGFIAYMGACASFIFPLLSEKKQAWLAYCLPSAIIIVVLYMVWDQYSTLKNNMETAMNAGMAQVGAEMQGMMKGMFPQMPSLFSTVKFQAGAYLMLAAAAFLSYMGVMKFKAESKHFAD